MAFHINDACWSSYPQDFLFDMMQSHELLFPGFVRPTGVYRPQYSLTARADEPYVDDFGCLWQTTVNGIVGTVTRHPLADWSSFPGYRLPDPKKCAGTGPVDWEDVEENIAQKKRNGEITCGGLRHGHTFLQLCDIRGYQNLLYDMADHEPNLWKLLGMVEEFNRYIINKYIGIGVDIMGYPEDLGMQTGPMLSPAYFKEYIKPGYQRLMAPARKAGAIVHMHSDGHLHALIDDIIDGGIDVVNLQDLVNGVDWIAAKFSGKTCVELDIDRQFITAKGTPQQIDSLIRDETRKIGGKMGGLMMIYGLYPGVPLENVKATMDAMEKYAAF